MINQDALKVLIHDDEAFQEVLENDPEGVLYNLEDMLMKVSTQLVKFGNEREDWFRRASSFSVILKRRVSESEKFLQGHLSDWKHELQGLVTSLYEAGFGEEELPEDMNSLKALKAWIRTVDLGD